MTVPAVFLGHVDAASRGDVAVLRELWEPEGVIEFPYASSLGTAGTLTGLDEITAYFSGLGLFAAFTVGDLVSWQIGDGQWLAEFHGSSTITATAAPYEQDYIVRFEISPRGRLSWLREYWDPTRL